MPNFDSTENGQRWTSCEPEIPAVYPPCPAKFISPQALWTLF